MKTAFIEHQIFEVRQEHLENFVKNDKSIWTNKLSCCGGFLDKEIWVTEERLAKVQIITYWESYEHFLQIDRSEFEKMGTEFTQKVGKENFRFVKALHEENKYFRISF